ncbi:MAG: DUF58 domain-containing protein [Betaproteobacteria bacterium]|nr:DUF58 domain-containing protein [Betaproteobacteria bacterium]
MKPASQSARRLRWRLLKRMPGLIQADFMSLARGSGFDLQHIQPYQEGDDVRRIDWHASGSRIHCLAGRRFKCFKRCRIRCAK